MEQLELFETGELVQIRHYLTCWNEAELTRRLAEIKNPKRINAVGKPAEAGGRK